MESEDGYCSVASLTPLQGLTESHIVALEGCGFRICDREEAPLSLYAKDAKDLWKKCEALDTLAEAEQASPGTDAFRREMLVMLEDRNEMQWQQVLQLVLRDLPVDVPSIELQGSGGFGVRITRMDVQPCVVELAERRPRARAVSAPDETLPFDTIYINGARERADDESVAFVEVPVGGLLPFAERLLEACQKYNLSEARSLLSDQCWVGREDGNLVDIAVDCMELVVEPTVGTDSGSVRFRAFEQQTGVSVVSDSVDIADLRRGLCDGERCYAGPNEDDIRALVESRLSPETAHHSRDMRAGGI